MPRVSSLSVCLRAGLFSASLLALPNLSRAGILDATMKAFNDNPDYVQPLATLYGSASNSGWYQSAAVAKVFGFYLGIPISLAYMSDDDRTYKGAFTDDGCVAYHKAHPSGTTPCTEVTHYKAPSIFGGKGPSMKRSVIDADSNIVYSLTVPTNGGVELMSKLEGLPWLMPQVGVSFWYTELKLRYMPIPDIAIEGTKLTMSMTGVGLQHDLNSFLPKMLPKKLPVDISVAANFSWLSTEFTPGLKKNDIDGKLKIDGFASFYGLLVGYRWAIFDVFLESGWETASMATSGKLTLNASGSSPEVLKPSLDVDGRNGFRAAINIAMHVGYDVVAGANAGANFGNQLSILGFRF